jgi:monoamine oxidase
MMRIAIVGGGPGGLLTAYELENRCASMFEATLFEASHRIGGKIITRQFQSLPVLYEAGVAEFYGYAHFAPDPVYDLVKTLGLETVEMVGPAVILGDTILNDYTDIRQFGQASLEALEDFYEHCEDMLDTDDYYECHWLDDNKHPWSRKTFREILDTIPDEIARKYIEVGVRSDVATEPHLTNALNGLKNILMDEEAYLRPYSIKGGNERLLESLARRLKKTKFVLETAVTHVGKTAEGKYRITTRHKGSNKDQEFDIVVMAMPNYWLARLEWYSRDLRMAMQKHLAAYDNPAHYLRISILFEKPFWRDKVKGSFFMSDTFGGCCIYDEGSWHESGSYGVLAWLLTGNDAMALTNCDDEMLLDMVLDSLPAPLAEGRSLFKEGRVQRWVGTINGQPGGSSVKSLRERHIPAPDTHPNLFVVGDYLFDSTVNGTYDSADFVVDTIQTILRKQKYAYQLETKITTQAVNEKGEPVPLHLDYYELYDGQRPYEESFEEFFCEHYTTDLIREIWGWSPPLQAARRRQRQRPHPGALRSQGRQGLGHRVQPADPCAHRREVEISQYPRQRRRSSLRGQVLRFHLRHLPLLRSARESRQCDRGDVPGVPGRCLLWRHHLGHDRDRYREA